MKNARCKIAAIAPIAAAVALGACSWSQPALPRRAGIARADTHLPADELRAVVDGADIFYLPVDRLELDERNGAALRLLNLLRESAARVAVAWANINAAAQGSFDQWNAGQTSLDGLLNGIAFVSAAQREAARRLLREAKERSVFAVTVACDASLGCTAQNVVREFQTLGGGKLLVVIDRRDLDPGSGVPFLVAQRLEVKQVVLDTPPGKGGAALMAGGAGATEIVDAAPGAGGNRR